MGTWPNLTPADLDLTVDTWDLQQILADTLGDLGTPADGFDGYLSDTLLILADYPGDIGSLLDDVGLAVGIAGLIDPNSLAGDAASFPASLAEGDAIVAAANALAGSVGPPPAPGGGGGSVGSGACSSLDFGSVPIGQSTSQTVQVINNTSGVVTVQSITFVGVGGANVFGISGAFTPTKLAPGQTLTLTVFFPDTFVTVQSYQSTMTANTDQPNPQPCMTLTGTIVAAASGGGGGTGGGTGGGGTGGGGGGGRLLNAVPVQLRLR